MRPGFWVSQAKNKARELGGDLTGDLQEQSRRGLRFRPSLDSNLSLISLNFPWNCGGSVWDSPHRLLILVNMYSKLINRETCLVFDTYFQSGECY